jgi:chlorophyll synthase
MNRPVSAALEHESPSAAAVLELLKPITWFPPMWAFACGLVSSGAAFRGRWLMVLTGVVLCGPLLCASSQAVNDWFDRHVDAINEPGRPIPSGRIPGRWGLYIALLWTVLSLSCAATLGVWVLEVAALGLFLAWAYSAPPIRLKRNGWWGNLACAVCYEGFAWLTGAAVLAGGVPSSQVFILAALYSLGAHGIMTLNDFKSVAGDQRMGIASLPVQLGVSGAARVACLAMLLPQLAVVMCLMSWGRLNHAAAIVVLIGAQLLAMQRFLSDPRQQATWYSGTGVTLYVSGMMVSAFALRGLVV